MQRRTALQTMALLMPALAIGPGAAEVPPRFTSRPARIAWPASTPILQWPPYAVFVAAMRERGWVEGSHFVVDSLSYDGRAERIQAVVDELLSRRPDLIIGSGTPMMPALMRATRSIPIVMFSVGDPEGQGFVASLGRPGGNVTGLSSLDHGLLVKQFELLLQAAPSARRVGVAINPDIPVHLKAQRDLDIVSLRHGVQIIPVPLRSREGLDACIAMLERERVDAVHFLLQPFLNTGDTARRAAELALERRWPTALADLAHVRAGMLLAYGSRIEDMLRRLPYFVTRILEGTAPGELPVEQPTRYYLSLNLKTARALGLRLPQGVLMQASDVVE